MKTLKVPVEIAATKGVSWLADQAKENGHVILTKFGRTVAVISSLHDAQRLNETLRH